jgi:hypothetical protein
MPTHLVRDHSQQVQRVDMIRMLRQDLPIQLLSLRKLSGLMKPKGGVERLIDGEFRHLRSKWISEPGRVAPVVPTARIRVADPTGLKQPGSEIDHVQGVLYSNFLWTDGSADCDGGFL